MSADYNPFLSLFGGLFASKPEPMTNAGRYLMQLDTGDPTGPVRMNTATEQLRAALATN
jgi:hypothetical protein